LELALELALEFARMYEGEVLRQMRARYGIFGDLPD
jgi:hypothetical protein